MLHVHLSEAQRRSMRYKPAPYHPKKPTTSSTSLGSTTSVMRSRSWSRWSTVAIPNSARWPWR